MERRVRAAAGTELDDVQGRPHLEVPAAAQPEVPERRPVRREGRGRSAHDHRQAGRQRRLLVAHEERQGDRQDDGHHHPGTPYATPVRRQHGLLGDLQPEGAREAQERLRQQGRRRTGPFKLVEFVPGSHSTSSAGTSTPAPEARASSRTRARRISTASSSSSCRSRRAAPRSCSPTTSMRCSARRRRTSRTSRATPTSRRSSTRNGACTSSASTSRTRRPASARPRCARRSRWRSTATRSARRSSSACVPCYTLVNPAFPWYDKASEKAHPYNPEKAKSMLAKAGHPKISFTTIVEADKTEQVLAQSVQAMLAKVGVNMKLEVHGADWFTVVPKSAAYITHDIGRTCSTPRCSGRARPTSRRRTATSLTSSSRRSTRRTRRGNPRRTPLPWPRPRARRRRCSRISCPSFRSSRR